jgi:iron complex outermembrane receptor protein
MIIMKSSWPRTCGPLSLAALSLALPAMLSAQSGGTVAGAISTADGNRPVERATISVSGRDARATTDVSGRYQISELPSGSYWIVARAIGLLPDSVQLSVVAGQTVRGDLALKRSTTTLQQVAITAQKRSESVQDVPVAVTALTADFLTKQSIQQFDALSAFVPGLNVQLQSPNNPGFVIRGRASRSSRMACRSPSPAARSSSCSISSA